MKPIHMITETKYYNIKVKCDLLGDIVIVCDYASRTVNNDHRYIIKVDSMQDMWRKLLME